jgi:alkanesulfonate monooxygenase SsuD/methylene tetrahydromethanopterin reductase-like flavin-dependent oxidoreductase (luciferase family)
MVVAGPAALGTRHDSFRGEGLVKIGVYIRLLGRPGMQPPPPSWTSIRAQALAAEAAGFDLVVFEDALWYPDDGGNLGVWETISMAAAVAASTSTIGVGHAVVNSPYRNPALLASIATTLDEISGGRYTLGIGLGNTPDDYPPFGVDADPRYSRFAEAIQIVHGLLREGRVDFDGSYYRAPGAELVLRGPRQAGPPIAIAAGKPRAMRLAARYGDEWNWWVGERDGMDGLRPLVDEIERACNEVDRDPATLRRSLDVFSVAVPGVPEVAADSGELRISGSPMQIADTLLAYGELGFGEVRLNLRAPAAMPRTEAIAWAAEVVSRVHAG